MRFLSPHWSELDWSAWAPLTTDSRDLHGIPTGPGVYRVRPVDGERLMYIGQTGRALRKRLRELRRFRDDPEKMPFNDPHTAAPSLWAWWHDKGMEFECSAAEVPIPEGGGKITAKRNREGLESYLLWQYRLEHGSSTCCNFGRFHPNYRKSKGKECGEEGRGGRLPDGECNPAGGPSQPPLRQYGRPSDPEWMHLRWSETIPLKRDLLQGIGDVPGLYKILDAKTHELQYIGQTFQLRARLRSHARNEWDAKELLVAYCCPLIEPLPHQLVELENDLIASYYDLHRTVPPYQILNKK